MKKFRKIRGVNVFILYLIFCVFIFSACDENTVEQYTEKSKDRLIVHFIDVGQADAILIQQVGDTTYNMLIDAGNNDDSDLLVDYLKYNGVKVLDTVIGTHPHEDHIGGLDKVIDTYDIDRVIMPKVTHTTKTFEDVISSIKNKSLKITTPKVGTTYSLGDAKWTILAPNSDSYEELNDYSVVIKLTYGDNSFMLTGDAEELSEKEIIKSSKNLGVDIESDVLKLGHHGSRSSTCDEFLSLVNPRIAIVSAGKDNDYGHPHKETLDKLNKKSIEILRTDKEGTIVIASDGKDLYYNDEEMVNNISKENNTSSDLIDETNKEKLISNDMKLVISHLDKKAELITITNNFDIDIDMDGWKLVSQRGNQEYVFKDYILKVGKSVIISSGDTKGDLDWGSKNVWNNSEKDPAVLYDNKGKEVSRFDN